MNFLFENITDKEKENILQKLDSMVFSYRKKQSLLPIGKAIGIIIKGKIKITKTDYEGNTYTIEELDEKEIFDTISFPINSGEYDIIAKEESQIILISFDEITSDSNNNSKSYNKFLKNLIKIMAQKINNRNIRIEILSSKTIRNKLLLYFKTFKSFNSNIITLPYSFTELASYLAVDRSAMNRELKKLKDDGLIEIKNKKIKLNYDVK